MEVARAAAEEAERAAAEQRAVEVARAAAEEAERAAAEQRAAEVARAAALETRHCILYSTIHLAGAIRFWSPTNVNYDTDALFVMRAVCMISNSAGIVELFIQDRHTIKTKCKKTERFASMSVITVRDAQIHGVFLCASC